MAEFGAKPCSFPGCKQHDFLPMQCSACARTFCGTHAGIQQHSCSEGEAFLASRRDEGLFGVTSVKPVVCEQDKSSSVSSSHPLSSSKPSEIMAAVASRFEGRQDGLNADVTHYNIAKGTDGGSNAGLPDKLLKNAHMAVEKATTAKGKRVSSQVHRMLLKSKAAGDKKLRMEDRFFLEVHYWGNEKDVHNLFFSRLWTVGRVLDDIVKSRRRFLRLAPGDDHQPLQLAAADSSRGLPIGQILHDLSPDLESFDAVMLRPRTAGATTTPSQNQSDTAAEQVVVEDGSHDSSLMGLPVASSGPIADGYEGNGQGTEEAHDNSTHCGGLNNTVQGISIMIGHGKSVHTVGGILPHACSVLDLKRRLEPLTGVPFTRQKLIFKGVLKDTEKIAATKIEDGVKVMLLGASTAGKW